MVRFSLKELFYWWTVWILLASLLTFSTSAFIASWVLVTVWFGGTVITTKLFGKRLAHLYSILIALFLMIVLLLEPPSAAPSAWIATVGLLAPALGTIVWIIALGADKAFEEIERRS